MSKLTKFIDNERNWMLINLQSIVKSFKESMTADPATFTEHGTDAPSVDIRLCIDFDRDEDDGSWTFRTGLVDYDPSHSDYCSSASIGLDTKAEDLLNYLIDNIDEWS